MCTTYTPRYLAWFNWLMPIEGIVYENDPNDAGGATKFGIDQRSHPGVNIRNLTLDDARKIYWDETWTFNHADELPAGVGEVVCRISMNCGQGVATKWLQRFTGSPVDGKFGPKTLAAAKQCNGPVVTKQLLDCLETHYRNLAAGSARHAKYLKGWLNAVASLRKFVKA